jgi:hypothetical protein
LRENLQYHQYPGRGERIIMARKLEILHEYYYFALSLDGFEEQTRNNELHTKP